MKNNIKKSGIIIESLPSTHFRVKLDSGEETLCHLAGKLRMFRIKILPGDSRIKPVRREKGKNSLPRQVAA